jgi:hypothetical protein
MSQRRLSFQRLNVQAWLKLAMAAFYDLEVQKEFQKALLDV